MTQEHNKYLPTRRSLLSRLKAWDDQEGWREFFNIYWKLIYSTACKAGLSDSEAQDVVQETILTVAKKMRQFRYDPGVGSFKGWLLNTTRWRIVDHLRKRQRLAVQDRSDTDFHDIKTVERIADPASLTLDSTWEDEWRQNLMDAAMERVKQRVNPKQFQMFELNVVKGWSVAQVAGLLQVSAAQVHLAKFRVSRRIKMEIKHLETKMI